MRVDSKVPFNCVPFKFVQQVEVTLAIQLSKKDPITITKRILSEKYPSVDWEKIDFYNLSQNYISQEEPSYLGYVKVKGILHYVHVCDECALYPELYGAGISLIHASSRKHSTSCYCAKNTPKAKYTTLMQCVFTAMKKQLIFVGINGKYSTRVKTTIIIYCFIHGMNPTNPTINAFLTKTNGCWICARISIVEANRNSNGGDAGHIEEMLSTGKFPEGTTFERSDTMNEYGKYPYWYQICPICSDDEYVQNGLCSGKFEGDIYHLKQGVKSCRCSSSFRWTKEQREYQIKKELEIRSTELVTFSFMKWVGEYENQNSIFEYFRTDLNQPQKIPISKFFGGRGCSMYEYGYKLLEDGRLYVNTDHSGDSDKTGVTQNGDSVFPRLGIINRSFKKHYGINNFWSNIICIYFNKQGGAKLAKDLEYIIHDKVGCGVPHNKEGFYPVGDGCSETYCISFRNKVSGIIKDFLDKHEGEFIIERDVFGLLGEVIA